MSEAEKSPETPERVQALVAERERADAANAAKSRLIATVSHEIKTPLSGMLGLTGLLLETALTKEQENFVGAIRSSGELLLGLVEELLDLAKLEAGRFDLHPGPVDLERMSEEIVELLAARANAKGLDLATYVAPGVPRPLVLDGPRLRQVLLNLAWNAVKFTEKGGAAIVVEPSGDRSADGRPLLRLSVIDSGPGIDPSMAAELLLGVEDIAPSLSGSGLGLPISRQIVRRMGGEIDTGTRPGGGAVFHFGIPYEKTPETEPAPEPGRLAGRGILAILGTGPAGDMLERHLADAGASLRRTTTSYQAAAMAAGGARTDMVIIDDRVETDPGGALQLIRMAAGRRLPATVLVGPGKRRDVDRLKEAGFDAYLVRPVRRKSLIRIVELMMSGPKGFQADPGEDRRALRPARAADGGLSVLLVEDDPVAALLVRSSMERMGHHVVEVGRGDAAWAAINDPLGRQFDVIVADLHVPGFDAMALARQARADERSHAPVLIAITADLVPEMEGEAEAAGFDAIMEKPVDPDRLGEVLAQLTVRAAA
jgi:CheY-like chemotaxis protein/nitrogen-specific signal transduction histidine kinase